MSEIQMTLEKPSESRGASHCAVSFFDSNGKFIEETRKLTNHAGRESLLRFIIWAVNNGVEIRIRPKHI